MPMKKKPQKTIDKSNLHRKRHKKLKAMGLVKGRLKKVYTEAEKHRLYRANRAAGNYADLRENPKKSIKGVTYTASSIKLRNRKEAKSFKKNGYTVYNGYAFIKHSTETRVRIYRNRKPKYDATNGERVLILELQTKLPNSKRVKVEQILLVDGMSILRFLEADPQAKMPRGVFITGKIGEAAPFKNKYPDAKDLRNYIAQWIPNDIKDSSMERRLEVKEELIGQMTVVFVQ